MASPAQRWVGWKHLCSIDGYSEWPCCWLTKQPLTTILTRPPRRLRVTCMQPVLWQAARFEHGLHSRFSLTSIPARNDVLPASASLGNEACTTAGHAPEASCNTPPTVKLSRSMLERNVSPFARRRSWSDIQGPLSPTGSDNGGWRAQQQCPSASVRGNAPVAATVPHAQVIPLPHGQMPACWQQA